MNNNKQKKDRLDVMLDMETLGTKAGSIILSVAMKTFTLDGHAPKEEMDFHEHISVVDALIMYHLRSEESTEDWWTRQSEVAREKMMDGQKNAQRMDNVMMLLYKVLKGWNERYELYLWGRGVGSFDLPLLDAAMSKVVGEGYKTPWKYWMAVDVRSIMNFCKLCGLKPIEEETPHDALEDVIKQIKEMQVCYQYVKVERAI